MPTGGSMELVNIQERVEIKTIRKPDDFLLTSRGSEAFFVSGVRCQVSGVRGQGSGVRNEFADT